jgi:hypothetical protein
MQPVKTSPTIRIGDDTAAAINELGGTFDSVDDVLKRLVEEAGHEKLLEQSQQAPDEEEQPGVSAKERKNQFVEKVQSLPQVRNVRKVDRSVWEADIGIVIKNLWIHYNAEFGFFSGSQSVGNKYSEEKPLLHVFLGPKENEFAVVPNEEFKSEKFHTFRDDENNAWRFNISHESNADVLSEYTSLSPITE